MMRSSAVASLALLFSCSEAITRGGGGGVAYGALRGGLAEVASLRAALDGGSCVPRLGEVADGIVEKAGEAVVAGGGDAKAAAQVCETLDGQLRVLYAKQLVILRDAAIQNFRRGGCDASEAEYAGMVAAERAFCREAEASSRAEWTYAAELGELRDALKAVAAASSDWRDAVIKAAQTRANCFTVLKKLAFELDAATASRLGNDSPWNAALAWRVPETNVNLSGALQRGKSNVVVSVVPDDSASLLGPNGFNKPRVGAGDLALSYKCDV